MKLQKWNFFFFSRRALASHSHCMLENGAAAKKGEKKGLKVGRDGANNKWTSVRREKMRNWTTTTGESGRWGMVEEEEKKTKKNSRKSEGEQSQEVDSRPGWSGKRHFGLIKKNSTTIFSLLWVFFFRKIKKVREYGEFFLCRKGRKSLAISLGGHRIRAKKKRVERKIAGQPEHEI